jgi:hypothetical protein
VKRGGREAFDMGWEKKVQKGKMAIRNKGAETVLEKDDCARTRISQTISFPSTQEQLIPRL